MVAYRKLVVGLLLCAAASACVTTSVTRLGQPMARPEVPMDQVAIYLTADKVPGRYEEVAMLNSHGAAGWTSEDKMMKNMRFEAGKIGANAIILDAISEPSAGAKIAAAVIGTGADRKGKAVAIFILPVDKR